MAISIISSQSNSLSAYTLKKAQHLREQSVAKISSGSASASGAGSGQIDSVSLKLKNTTATESNLLSNVNGALSFLDAQAKSLTQIGRLVNSMGEIVSKMQDVTKTSSDRFNFMEEFNALRVELSRERNSTYNGIALHDKSIASTAFQISTGISGLQSVSFTRSDFATNGSGTWDTLLGAVYSQPPSPDGGAAPAADGGAAPAAGGGAAPVADGGGAAPAADGGAGAVTEDYGQTLEEVVVSPPTNTDSGSTGSVSNSEGTGGDLTSTPTGLMSSQWGAAAFEFLASATASMLATNAAQQSMLLYSADAITSRGQPQDNALSKVSDANVASELANLAKTQLVTQSASSAMSQTNLAAEGVVKALWGEPSSGIEWYKPPKMTTAFEGVSF